MATLENTTGYLSLLAGEDLAAYRRVKRSGDTWVYADADVIGDGVTTEAADSGLACTVKLFSAPGTFLVTASATIAALGQLYATADGEVDDGDAGSVPVPLKALQSASDGDVIDASLSLDDPANTTSSVAVAADELAIPLTARYVAKTTGADAEALTLADGSPGQRINIALVVDGGGAGTLTPATCSGFATIVFADAGDIADLEYVDDTVGWVLVGTAGVAAPPAITV